MAQPRPGGDLGLQGAERTILPPLPKLRLQPVRQKSPELPLRPLIAAKEHPRPRRRRHEQVRADGLLRRTEEGGMGGDAPLAAALLLVQDPAQQQAALAVSGIAV